MMIEALHHAILATIKKEVPGIITYGMYPKVRSPIKTPAVFVDLASLDPGNDPGTGQIALMARMEARVIMGADSNAALKTRELAAKVASVIHHNNFGVNVSPAKFSGASPDGFRPELDAYEVWLVEWSHEIDIGESVWNVTEGITPQTVYLGYAPEIGRDYEDKYDLVDGKPC